MLDDNALGIMATIARVHTLCVQACLVCLALTTRQAAHQDGGRYEQRQRGTISRRQEKIMVRFNTQWYFILVVQMSSLISSHKCVTGDGRCHHTKTYVAGTPPSGLQRNPEGRCTPPHGRPPCRRHWWHRGPPPHTGHGRCG